MIFEIPIRTKSGNHGHGREHWAARARRVKAERTAVALTLPLIRMPNGATVTLTRIAPRPLDDDNACAALKGVRDEVAHRLGVDDRDPSVKWAYAQERGAPKYHAVRIRIEAAT